MFRLCVSQEENVAYYRFKVTGVRVYTIEEALYHVFYNWREAVDDFCSNEMVVWLNKIGLSFLGSKIKDIANTPFSESMLRFLSLVPYFDQIELDSLKSDLISWENRREWEQYKERADFLMKNGEPQRAIPLYKKALEQGENTHLLNNLAIAKMQLGEPKEAAELLNSAIKLSPNNIQLMFNYAESCILSRDFQKAEAVINNAEKLKNSHETHYLRGLLFYHQNNSIKAGEELKIALDMHKSSHYACLLADIYLSMRRYNDAQSAIDKISNKDAMCYAKEAEIHEKTTNWPGAVKSIKKAIESKGLSKATLWAKLAYYYRRDYDNESAQAAIEKALKIDPENNIVRLENARIKKNLGKTREYQAGLNQILEGLKLSYRLTLS